MDTVTEAQELTKNVDEEDLEEGELKDDDDDDEEFEADDVANNQKSANPSEISPSSSSSSSPKESKDHSSSKSSSIERSHHSSPSHNNTSSYERPNKVHLSKTRFISDDRYRHNRDREKEDPSEKAAKLISMRTKLLEARSREIELKFLKNKGKVSPPPPSPSLISTILPRNLKMTVAKPSISYSENQNPPMIASMAVVSLTKKIKHKSTKSEDREKKTKKKTKKKKKKSSSRKHKKHKSGSSNKKGTGEVKASFSQGSELHYELNDHQGPRTPPDNHVTTLEDEQIEWPSHLIKMTTAQPAISYSVNPRSVLDTSEDDRRESLGTRRRKSTNSSLNESRKSKHDEKHSSLSSSPSQRAMSSSSHRADEGAFNRKHSPSKSSIYELDLNFDYTWYYNYFLNSFDMNSNQAQHQALAAMITTGSYKEEILEKWLHSRGLSKISISDPDVQKQLYPFPYKESLVSPVKSEVANDHVAQDKLETSEIIKTIVTRIDRNHINQDPEEKLKNNLNSASNDLVDKATKDDDLQLEIEVKTENSTDDFSDDKNVATTFDTDDIDKKNPVYEVTQVKPKIEAVSVKEESISLRPIQPRYTVIKSQRELVLPNGHILPPGTIQKIVHPYPRTDSEVLGCYYDVV